MSTDAWLLEMVSLAEEIRHGLGTTEKSRRLADLVLNMHERLFEGGALPQAWNFPVQAGFHPPTVPPGSPPFDEFDHASLDEDSVLENLFAEEAVTEPLRARPSGTYPLSANCLDDLSRVLDGIVISDECLTGST